MNDLTKRQMEVLDAISKLTFSCGRPPSINELMDRLDIASPNGVAKHLIALEAKGYIHRDKGARGIRICRTAENITPRLSPDSFLDSVRDSDVAFIPLVGTIAAGAPLLAQENIEEMIPVPQSMTDGAAETFFLRVKGDSMIDEGMLSGDLVMVSKCDQVSNGEIAAVMVDEEATVKRFYLNKGKVILEPANEAYEPIVVDPGLTPCKVIGRVTGLLRSYKARI